MQKNALYTIGHGSRKTEELLSLLKEFRIEYLIDVRSKPYSRFNPQYNQKELQFFLQENGITYVFMGDKLGGRPQDSSCYNKDGKVNYNALKTKAFFKSGIERLKIACGNNFPAAIMCSERNPAVCHRTLLIGEVLYVNGLQIKHIDETGKLKEHATLMNELYKQVPDISLFNGMIDF